MHPTRTLLSALLIGTFLSGCSLAPDFKKPDVTVPSKFKEDHSEALDGKWQQASQNAGQADLGNWWLIFGDEQLNTLQQQAAETNNDLKSAAARLEQARALTQQARGSVLPDINIGGNAMRGNAASASFGAGAAKPVTVFSAQGSVSYETDLFGRLRSALKAARYNEAASEALYHQARLFIHSDVAQNYYTLLALDTERDLLRQSIKLRSEAEKLLQRRFKEGEASEQEYLRAQAELSVTESELSALDQRRALTEHALAILVGKSPSEFALNEKKLPLNLPVVPAGLPSTLLERRPDVAAAESQLRAANERIGAARAAFFPSLNLTATGGFASNELGDLFNWSSRSWALGPIFGTALSIPVFDGGTRKGLLKQAKAGYEENVADYRQQVLIAFKDVEDNLSSLHYQAEQADHLFSASQASSKAYRLSDIRYKEGETSYLEVIDTQRDMLNAQRNYTQVQGARFVTTINLIRALGGGWDMPQGIATPVAEPVIAPKEEIVPKANVPAPAPVAEPTQAEPVKEHVEKAEPVSKTVPIEPAPKTAPVMDMIPQAPLPSTETYAVPSNSADEMNP